MDNRPLFRNDTPKLEKRAGHEIRLSENPAKWQQEITTELFKQVPYISDFTVNVMLEQVNPERGYGLGTAKVSQDRRGILIPLFVKERLLKPIDVFFFNGAAYPLTEERVRRAMLTTTPAHLTDRKGPSDQGMVQALFPPIRTSFGFGNQVTFAGDQVQKMAEEGHPMPFLSVLSSTTGLAPMKLAISDYLDEPWIASALEKNAAFRTAVEIIASSEIPDFEKIAEDNFQPDVVQLRRTSQGFLLKVAAADAYAPQQQVVEPGQASEMFGTNAVSQMRPGQEITASTNQTTPSSPAGMSTPISSYGRYTCWDANSNRPLVGCVIPLLTYQGKPAGMFLFMSAESKVFAVQDSLVGIEAMGDPAQDIPDPVPLESVVAGPGVAIRMRPNVPVVYTPVDVQLISKVQDQLTIHGVDPFGEGVQLSSAPELKIPMVTPEGIFLPGDAAWLPLQGQQVQLLQDQPQMENLMASQNAKQDAEVRGFQDGTYNVSGPPVAGLPPQETTQIKTAEAKFLLVGMGLDPVQADHVLHAANGAGRVKVSGLRKLYAPKKEKVAYSRRYIEFARGLATDLIKEAAVIDDYDSVDKVLSLGFLNEDNLEMFRAHLPTLEASVSRLAELLLASRMGLTWVQESALSSALKAVDKVTSALRSVQQ